MKTVPEFDTGCGESDDLLNTARPSSVRHWKWAARGGVTAILAALVLTLILAHGGAPPAPPGRSADTVVLDEALADGDCSHNGENCMHSGCCTNSKLTCYMKNDDWAGCKKSCTPGIDPSDPEEAQTEWSCDAWVKPTGAPAVKGESCDCNLDDCTVGDSCQYCPDMDGACCKSGEPDSKKCDAWQVTA